MITCEIGDGAALTITFRLADPALHDRRISVVGDFNDWDPAATVLQPGPGGVHTATVRLPVGRHRFRYVTDRGDWFGDETAHGHEYNEFGQRNCLLDLALLSRPRSAGVHS